MTDSPLELNSSVADDNFFLKENRRLRQLLAIYRWPGLQLPESIADQLDSLRIELAPRMTVADAAYSRFARPLKQALWAARELGERVLVITFDQKSIDECGRLLRSYAADHTIHPLASVDRRDYLEFANKGSIRVITIASGGTSLVGLRFDSIVEVL